MNTQLNPLLQSDNWSTVLRHQPCPDQEHCGSSDGASLRVHTDTGREIWNCFSCGKSFPVDNADNTSSTSSDSTPRHYNDRGNNSQTQEKHLMSSKIKDLLNHPFRPLADRQLSQQTLEYFGTRVRLDVDGHTIKSHLYPYYSQHGKLIAYKERVVENKEIFSHGTLSRVQLFGQQNCQAGGKTLYITEGELDAMAVLQTLKRHSSFDWSPAVTSVSHGAQSSLKSITDNWEFVNSFERVVLVFDNDDAGEAARTTCCEALAGKGSFVTLTEKDPCDMLLAGKDRDLYWALMKPEKYHPEDIISDYEDILRHHNDRQSQVGYPYPSWMPDVQSKLRDARKGQIILLTAGTGCVDADTEYFNGEGWTRIGDYDGGQVMQYDNGESSMVQPLKYIKEPCHKLTHIKTKYGLDMQLCDDHRVVYRPEGSDVLDEKTTKEIGDFSKFRGKIPTTFIEYGQPSDYTVAEMMLHVAVTADSSVHGRKVVFKLKKHRKIERLKSLLQSLNIEYKSKLSNGYDVISFHYNIPKGFSKSWYKLPYLLKKTIARESLLWDGDQKSVYYTTKKDEADFIQYCFASTGTKAVINIDDRLNKPLCYSVVTTQRTFVGTRNSKHQRVIKPSDGFKYCFTVPSGMLVLRRNGKIFVTGNCGKTQMKRNLEVHFHDILPKHLKIGDISLEEQIGDCTTGLAEVQMGKRYTLPEIQATKEEESAALEHLFKDGRFTFYDHQTNSGDARLFSKLNWMAATGHEIIFLDHLHVIISEFDDNDNERKRIDTLMYGLRDFVVRTGCILFLLCHLKYPDGKGKTFEEGRVPTLDDFRGSSSIKQVIWDGVGLQRYTQHEDEYVRKVTRCHVLKCRQFGTTGPADCLMFNDKTARYSAVPQPEGF